MSNTEEKLYAMNSYMSGLSTANISDEVKRHAQAVLGQDIGRGQPREGLSNVRGDHYNDPSKAAAELKATQNNPGVANLGKKKAYEELIRKGGETPEGW